MDDITYKFKELEVPLDDSFRFDSFFREGQFMHRPFNFLKRITLSNNCNLLLCNSDAIFFPAKARTKSAPTRLQNNRDRYFNRRVHDNKSTS
jgi:hypothetical protein